MSALDLRTDWLTMILFLAGLIERCMRRSYPALNVWLDMLCSQHWRKGNALDASSTPSHAAFTITRLIVDAAVRKVRFDSMFIFTRLGRSSNMTAIEPQCMMAMAAQFRYSLPVSQVFLITQALAYRGRDPCLARF